MAKTSKKASEAVEAKFDEFREFVLENRDIIEKILEEGREAKADVASAVRDTAEKTRKKLSSGLEDAEDAAFATFRAVTSKEVQGHFVRMGLEFIQGMDALIRALPLPGLVGDAYEEANAAGDRFGETVCENNPDCLYRKLKAGKKGSAKDRPKEKPSGKKLEKIELS